MCMWNRDWIETEREIGSISNMINKRKIELGKDNIHGNNIWGLFIIQICQCSRWNKTLEKFPSLLNIFN